MTHEFTSTKGRPLAVETVMDRWTCWVEVMNSPLSPDHADID
ncbi:hypothetical protein AH4AK4_0819 [Aeromonas hydrophila 4AK4]|nr:hypothetical protein AH4AK4_0819 [Aeromonas hydrophila 4AK4]